MSETLLKKVQKLLDGPTLEDWEEALNALRGYVDGSVEVVAVMNEYWRTHHRSDYDGYFTRGNREEEALIEGILWSWKRLAGSHEGEDVHHDYVFRFSEGNHARIMFNGNGQEDVVGTWIEIYEKIIDLTTAPEVPPIPKSI